MQPDLKVFLFDIMQACSEIQEILTGKTIDDYN